MIKLFKPTIQIKKSSKPVVFIDTYIWQELLSSNHEYEKELLYKVCKEQKILVVITNAIEGELKNRGLLKVVQELCDSSLVRISVGQITANQIIQSMACFFENRSHITLGWDLMISEVPILDSNKSNLKQLFNNITEEIIKAMSKFSGTKKELVSIFCKIELEVWKSILTDYREFLEKGKENQSYKDYFFTDFLVDLPSIVIRSYLFAYIANEKTITVQDVIDVYTISESMPFTVIFITDKAQHNRLKQLKKDFPKIFNFIEENSFVSSSLYTSRLNPLQALNCFLSSL